MELNKKLVNFESMNENTKLTLAEALLYTKGLAGGYGGDFPLSTASKDSIYRVPATNKFYVCTENYNGSQISAPNSNFVELSVWKNHDRLANLKNKLLFDWNFNKVNISNNISVLQANYKDIEVEITKDCNILVNYSGYNNTNAVVVLYKNGTPIARAGGSYSLEDNISLCSITKVSKGDKIKMESHRIHTNYPELLNFTICEI